MKKLSFLFGLAIFIAAIFVSASGPVSAASQVTEKGNTSTSCPSCTAYGTFSLTVRENTSSLQRPPISGANVSVFKMPSVGTQPVATGTTDANGNYSTGLPSGNYMFKVSAIGYNNATQNFTIVSSQTTHATAYMSSSAARTDGGNPSPCANCAVAPGMFKINVREMSSSLETLPIAGASVSVYTVPSISTQPVATGTTDANGNFSTSLPAGNYMFKVTANTFNQNSQTFTIVSSQTTHSTAYMSHTDAK